MQIIFYIESCEVEILDLNCRVRSFVWIQRGTNDELKMCCGVA